MELTLKLYVENGRTRSPSREGFEDYEVCISITWENGLLFASCFSLWLNLTHTTATIPATKSLHPIPISYHANTPLQKPHLMFYCGGRRNQSNHHETSKPKSTRRRPIRATIPNHKPLGYLQKVKIVPPNSATQPPISSLTNGESSEALTTYRSKTWAGQR